ncbi:unnamed protein product [Cuscuta epithymum]|uniref:Uncharacterized protein n=1 Tax=Cuscuta epithymum TaxID=186058 RepID=A0AAV0G950_9ASTE|nr:unnamed protein product [Cuscuta epithymum]
MDVFCKRDLRYPHYCSRQLDGGQQFLSEDTWIRVFPLIAIGVLMLLCGFLSCVAFGCDTDECKATYMVVMGILLLLMFAFVISLAVYSTYSGSAEKAPGRGYAEYRFRSFSSWLRGKVSDKNGWTGIATCLGLSEGPCGDLKRTSFSSSEQLYAANLTPSELYSSSSFV